ncbi:hypothetical protein AcV7_001850 [Taiwanofungus camphoratus]|nr:hypothetical protein AcV7_001850 [Antrodia cinnamomea]
MEEDDDRDDGPAYYGEVTVGPRPDPDLELDDDELDGVRNAVSGAGFYAFPPQVQANLDGLSMLEAMPIIGSAVEVLHVYITWTPLALFGIKMMCQMVSTRTKVFHLTLIFKLSKSLVSTKWDRIDSLLAEVQPPEIPGADFRLYLRADWDASPDTLIEATRKYVQQLPQIRECGLFTITSTSGELEDPEAAADEQFWENCQ